MQENGGVTYVQSAAIPFRHDASGVRFLIITNVAGGRWIFPKGLVEDNMTPEESALQEAFEEAGAVGVILPDAVGRYTYQKWGGNCEVDLFLMRVERLADDWPERDWRRRKWVTREEAMLLVDERIPRSAFAVVPDDAKYLPAWSQSRVSSSIQSR